MDIESIILSEGKPNWNDFEAQGIKFKSNVIEIWFQFDALKCFKTGFLAIFAYWCS